MTELHRRSVIKGATWRIVGTIDTILLSWLFTGRFHAAVKIGGIELITKIALYYFHERLWLRIPYGRAAGEHADGTVRVRENRRRSIAKGVSWRVLGTIDTMIIAFFITGSHVQAASIGITEVFTKILLFYLHERAWNRIPLGRR